ncbi:hypothetical protein Tco_0780444 [Tanacetum coccineum]
MNVKARRVGDASSTAPSAKNACGTRQKHRIDADKANSSNHFTYANLFKSDRVKTKVNFWSLESDVGSVEADLITPMASVQEVSDSFAILYTDTLLPKVGKQKDVEDDGFQGMKGKASKGGKWKIQGNRFNKSINGSYKAVVKSKSSISVSNPFSTLEEDNDNLIDDMVDDTRKNVTHYFVWDDTEFDDMGLLVEEVEHGNASSENE